MNKIHVTKRDGRKEPLDISKLHRVVMWACEGLTGVSASELELKSQILFNDGITSAQIQETLIKAAHDLIDEESPNYQYVAGRLINFHLRKQVYGQFEPDSLTDIVKRNVERGLYTPELLEWYSEEDFDHLDRIVDHTRDCDYAYAGMEQWRGKYLVKDRVTGEILETPQIANILIPATIFAEYPDRFRWIREFYDALSRFAISLPTPVMSGVRSAKKQFSSCVLIDAGDTLDSINASSSAIVKYVSQRAGIGLNLRLRGYGASVQQGYAKHTGITPFIKKFQGDVGSCSQGGIRGGKATCNILFWHSEIREMLVLKNNKGTEDNRARGLDYCVQLSKVMYERLLKGGNISLFQPNAVPGMYEAYFQDTDKFRRMYEKAERDPSIVKETVPAVELFSFLLQERKDTGRIYILNVDHANDHGGYDKLLATIYMTNLCTEILHPTKPLNDLNDPEGEIGTCTLAAINAGVVKEEEFPKIAKLLTHFLDTLLTYQDYPVLAAKITTHKRRQLGIGVINFAYWMAKNGFTYDNVSGEALTEIHRWFEAWSYHLISASINLAEQRGACSSIADTKYSKGIVPIDTYKKDVDDLVDPVYYMDWDELRNRLRASGIRNSTLMAGMPSETSSQISNATNGFEPVRALISVKQSKDGVLRQVVPEIRRFKNKYDLLWEMSSPEGYLKIMAVVTKFFDQAISVNTSYNPQNYSDGEIPMSELMKHLVWCYKYGLPTLYYNNTHDGAGEVQLADDTAEKQIEQEEELCDGCIL